ncbi:SagB-type dehydrogenase family enzyme [Kitasatospora sp. MAA4]|uniref:SagB family peptide dehydrogenase n=1 Tax=Kitasatospora sp. MAA4 TaxID=3035093 RepID=UPI002473CBDA|nr:SagB family peptide dehydrogenase [Kitasatospora sp. MAA4]MDH6131279.1 SagB-type dehydrogenase family enzyme [Kitasatospora sp. MAA4]
MSSGTIGGAEHTVAFRADVRLYAREGGLVVFRSPRSYVLEGVSAAVRAVLDRLVELPVALDSVEAAVPLAADRRNLARILDHLSHLLDHQLGMGERVLACIEPLAAVPVAGFPAAAPEGVFRLSRFALCRSLEDEFVLEAPQSPARVRLPDRAACALVARLARPATAAELVKATGLDEAAVGRLLGALTGLGLVVRASDPAGSEPPAFAEDVDPDLRPWDFHDRLFHARSRHVRRPALRFLDELPARPATKAPAAGEPIALFRPSPADVLRADPPFSSVLESRRSLLRYGEHALTAEQLGEFLYRVARIRAHYGTRPGSYYDWDTRPPFERTSRPYPSTDAAYELELYLTVRRCQDLPAGVYHYDPMAHALRLLDTAPRDRAALIRQVGRAHKAEPDVLLLITSRIQRISWSEQSIAYALTLKHVGVLYQTMYLVATAMGLAPCALKDAGEPELTVRLLGLDETQEVPVGDFALGSAPGGSPADDERLAGPNWQPVNDPQWPTGH